MPTYSHSSVPRLHSQGFLERLGDEVIAGVELIRAKALALVGMGGGGGGSGGGVTSGSSSRSGFEEKQGYYDAGSDLEASGSAVSSKGANSTIKRSSECTLSSIQPALTQRHNEFITFSHLWGIRPNFLNVTRNQACLFCIQAEQ